MIDRPPESEPTMIENGKPELSFHEKPHIRLAAFGIGIFVLAASILTWRYFAVRASTDDAQIDGHVNPVSPRVGGTVLNVLVVDNQYVEAGTVLFEIDPTDYRVSLERAQADLAAAQAAAQAAQTGVPITSTTTGSQLSSAQANVLEARARMAGANDGVAAAKARLSSSRARLAEAQANETKARQDLGRMKQLVAKDEVSQQQYDAAVAAEAGTSASVDSARANVTESQQSVSSAQAQLAQAQAILTEAQAGARTAETAPEQIAVMRARANSAKAQVELAQAALDQAKLNMQYTTIKAPVSGIVSEKSVEVGQVVQAGQPLLAIVPLNDIWVTANFKETQLKNMRPGQRAVITVDATGGRKYYGRVESIAAATGARFSLLPPENATGNYVKVVQRIPVKIVFDKGQDPEHLLRPGMSVTPTVFTD